LDEVRPLNDNEGSPEPGGTLPTLQSIPKLILRQSVFWSLPGNIARASAADAQRAPARQREDPLPTLAEHWRAR
jgi:hypothetical protein